jgi:hypothetical protein
MEAMTSRLPYDRFSVGLFEIDEKGCQCGKMLMELDEVRSFELY